MPEIQLGIVESKFADIIWDNEPMPSSMAVKLAEEKLGWKKSTTFTVIRRLCDTGIFINEKGIIRSLISKQDFYSMQSEKFVDETFGGSLPAFLAAFTKRKALSEEEVRTLRDMIDAYKED